ncbi:MAG: hypothetical protein JW953_14820 [Anaerolineae bacterium]|nr:hypothetical protein [Anaerolineae bacterium]
MRRLQYLGLAMLVILISMACSLSKSPFKDSSSPNEGQHISRKIIILRSPTPTATFTPTFTPTLTPTFTPTFTPSPTKPKPIAPPPPPPTPTPTPTPVPNEKTMVVVFNEADQDIVFQIEGQGAWDIAAKDNKAIELPPGEYTCTVQDKENAELATCAEIWQTDQAYQLRFCPEEKILREGQSERCLP